VRDEGIKKKEKEKVGLTMGVHGSMNIEKTTQRVLNSLSRQISRQATEQVMIMHLGVVNPKIVSFFKDR
jgi:hypothetical protein